MAARADRDQHFPAGGSAAGGNATGGNATAARPVAALGYPGRFAVYDPGLLDAGQLSALDPPDTNGTGKGAMPSVQGYTSLADGRYAAATGSHLATGEEQDVLSPRAVADGALDELDTSVLLPLPAYLVTSGRDSAAAAGPAGTGQRDLPAGQRTTWYLGSAVEVSEVSVPDPDARRDAAAGARIGLMAPDGRTRWFPARAISGPALAITFPRMVTAVAVTGQAQRSPSLFGPPAVVTEDAAVLTADGQLQDALVPPRWTLAGFDGSFAVFADRFARGPLTIQALPGRSAAGARITAVTGTPGDPRTATVVSAHGARVVRSVAAIPGWTAAWHPERGPAVTLTVQRDGLVQAVDVPPGPGVMTWSYTTPGFPAGLAMSAAAALVALLAMAALGTLLRQDGHGSCG